ncbi:hypothetical protein M6B38_109675 [Iris pallida]|uniref:Uncharacterized protein n=1 Tax=Iris pallida TaxID=29817 RepID=A0AAX6E919_IRIPA|nr:hypothetical protein M6B38_109675 [Iris pallida]
MSLEQVNELYYHTIVLIILRNSTSITGMEIVPVLVSITIFILYQILHNEIV